MGHFLFGILNYSGIIPGRFLRSAYLRPAGQRKRFPGLSRRGRNYARARGMSPLTALLILVTVLVTAFISGIFGMAGGLILMGVLTALLPVATAMVVHGAVQMVSNGYRAILWRRYIDWRVFRRYAAGSFAAFLMLLLVAWRPEARAVYLLLGLPALLVWLPRAGSALTYSSEARRNLRGSRYRP